jgi:hypothetical protein
VFAATDDRDGGPREELAQASYLTGGVDHGRHAVQLCEGLGVVEVVAAEDGGNALGVGGHLELVQELLRIGNLGCSE